MHNYSNCVSSSNGAVGPPHQITYPMHLSLAAAAAAATTSMSSALHFPMTPRTPIGAVPPLPQPPCLQVALESTPHTLDSQSVPAPNSPSHLASASHLSSLANLAFNSPAAFHHLMSLLSRASQQQATSAANSLSGGVMPLGVPFALPPFPLAPPLPSHNNLVTDSSSSGVVELKCGNSNSSSIEELRQRAKDYERKQEL